MDEVAGKIDGNRVKEKVQEMEMKKGLNRKQRQIEKIKRQKEEERYRRRRKGKKTMKGNL